MIPAPARAARRSPDSTPAFTADIPKHAPAVLNTLGWTAVLVTSVVVLAQGLVLLGSQIDDPYIFARYAANLAQYGDLVWNAGEPRIEGFSSWLWLGVQFLGIRLHVDPVVFAKLVGVAAGALLAGHAAHVILRYSADVIAAAAAIIVLVASPALAYYAASGMDHIAWALIGWLYVVRVGRSDSVRVSHSVAAGLGILIRPEGFLLFLPAATLVMADVLGARDRRAALRSGFRTLMVGVLVLAALLVMRRLLFDAWLPNAAAVKHLGGPILERLIRGALYVGPGFAAYLAIPNAAVALTITAASGGGRRLSAVGPCQRTTLAALAFATGVVGLALVAGGDDVAAFGPFRLIVPAIVPSVFLLVAVFSSSEDRRGRMGSIVVIMTLCLLARTTYAKEFVRIATRATNLSSAGEILTAWTTLPAVSQSPLATYLIAETPPREYIAVPWAGLIPFQTALPTIDLLGLNDRVMGRGNATREASYVLDKRPYFICENVLVTAPLATMRTLTDSQLRGLGAFKASQRALLRERRLATDYQADPRAPFNGTCFRRRLPADGPVR